MEKMEKHPQAVLARVNAKEANVVFRHGRVIDPARGFDHHADMLIIEGRLVEIGPQISLSPDRLSGIEEVDAGGWWLVPGLLDMHVHLREPGEEYKETIASGTRAAAVGGYTGVACMPNTHPVNDNGAVTEFILSRAAKEGAARVFPVGAISRGLEGEKLAEFGELRDAGAVAVSDDGRPVMNALLMRRALEYARIFDLPVISHCEELSLSQGGLMNEGAMSTLLGLHGIPKASEEIMVARDLLLAELTQSRIHIAHVSTAGSVLLIRQAKQRGVLVTAETAPHYFMLTDEEVSGFDAVFKVNPPLRRREDVRAIREGLADGTLDAIATDHAPHSVLEKDIEFEYAANGMIGLESALPLVLEIVREGILSPLQAMAKLVSNPAKILQLDRGTFKPGSPVDLTVIDPDAAYVLDSTTFQSKSLNCPFHGREVQGRAVMTVVDGRIVFSKIDP